MSDANHRIKVVSAFDKWSSNWSENYADGSRMGPRIARYDDALKEHADPGGTVLDFGCGTGEIARGLAASGWRVTAVDASAGMIEQAEKADTQTEVKWIGLDHADTLPFEDASFDAVISSSVFEYLADPTAQAREIVRILKPGGWFVLTVPDPRHPERDREARRMPLARSTPIWRLICLTRWRDEFTYLRISINRWPPEKWVELLSSAGFRVDQPTECSHPLLMLGAQKT